MPEDPLGLGALASRLDHSRWGQDAIHSQVMVTQQFLWDVYHLQGPDRLTQGLRSRILQSHWTFCNQVEAEPALTLQPDVCCKVQR